MTTGTTTQHSDRPDAGILLRIFPGNIDNRFRGQWLALLLFGFYVFARLAMGAKSVFDSYATAATADGMPLASYGPHIAQTMVQMFALLGLDMMVLPALGVIALVRYRAMIPLLYLAMLTLDLGRRAVHYMYPDASAGAAPPMGFYVNLGLTAVLLVGFALSLTRSQARDGKS